MKLMNLALAIIIPLAVGALQYQLWQFIDPYVWFLFFPTVFFMARFTGFWGGMVSTIVSVLVVWYGFVPPEFSWKIDNPQNIFPMVVFLIMGYFFSDSQRRLTESRDSSQQDAKFIAKQRDEIAVLYQQNLALDEIKFSQLANSIPQIVWVTTASGDNIFFNDEWYAYTGLSPEESMGHGWNKPFHPEDQGIAWDAWQNAVKNNARYSLECRLRGKDGSYRWWLIRGAPAFNIDHRIEKWFGTCTDIHELKLSQEAERNSRAKLLAAFNSMNAAMLMVDQNMQITNLNEAFVKFHHLKSIEDCPSMIRDHESIFDVRDADGKLTGVADWPATKALNGESGTNLELTLNLKGSSESWVGSYNYAPILGLDRRIDGAVITIRDITTQKAAEKRLKELLQEQSNILNSRIAGIAKTKARKFEWVNQRFADNFGYKIEELLGQSSQILYPDVAAYDHFGRQIDSVDFEKVSFTQKTLELKHKDGSLGWYLTGGGPIVKGSDESIWISFDITNDIKNQELLGVYAKRLEKVMEDTLLVLSNTVDVRDPYTAGHQQRVGSLAQAIAMKLGLSQADSHNLNLIGLIHDIGKIGIPAELLSKPTRLSNIEYELIKTHATIGYEILKNLNFMIPVAEIVREHHERIDGSGYPQGLKGDQILMEARILAVADTVEAMSAHRPYRPALGIDAALAEIEQGRGTKYEPRVVDACLELFRKDGYQIPSAIGLI
jgi:PAS domain S-box-containing protein/putative nucleotidyltransferase with HDIG domain